jgi:phage-related protein
MFVWFNPELKTSSLKVEKDGQSKNKNLLFEFTATIEQIYKQI